jgi:hypothetical protein
MERFGAKIIASSVEESLQRLKRASEEQSQKAMAAEML